MGGKGPDEARLQLATREKNPLVLRTFKEQGAAIESKLIRLDNDARYQKMTPQERVATRAKIYNTYVVPSFKQNNVPVPDIKTWLAGTKSEHIKNLNPGDQFRNKGIDTLAQAVGGMEKSAFGMTVAGLKVENRALMSVFGLQEYFKGTPNEEIRAKAEQRANKSFIGKAVAGAQDGLNSTNFWLQTHPRDSMLAGAAGWTGEQVIQLPLYEAVGGLIAVGGATKVGAALTPKLMATPVGKFVAKRLTQAAEGFFGSLAAGDTKSEAGKTAAGFAILGGYAEIAGEAIKGIRGVYTAASDATIKTLTANTIAMGGKPLAEELTHSVMGEFAQYGSPEKQAELFRGFEKRKVEDPVLHTMHDAEAKVLNDLAKRHYGQSITSLPPKYQARVVMRRLELMHEAATELPARVPDLNHAEVEHEWEAQVKENPGLGKSAQMLKEQFGIDITKVVSDNQVNDIKEQTGIKNTPDTAKKIQRVRAKATDITSGSASLSPSDFDNHVDSTVAYFRNREPRRAADGTLVGGRDKRPWNVRLKAENTKEFINTLKEADGDVIKFENPYHRMLFHWAQRDKLPTPVREKLLYEMKKVTEGKGFKAADFNTQADWGLVHLQKLSQSGALAGQGNVFASTKTFGAPTEWQLELETDLQKQELKMLKTIVKQHPGGEKAMQGVVGLFQISRQGAKTPEEWQLYNRVINNLVTGIVK